jgi:hypothetical protein
MTLIYGLLDPICRELIMGNIEVDEQSLFAKKVKSIIATEEKSRTINISSDDIKYVEDCFNQALAGCQKDFIATLFNDNINISKILIHFNFEINYTLTYNKDEDDIDLRFPSSIPGLGLVSIGAGRMGGISQIPLSMTLNYILENIIRSETTTNSFQKPFYLPASRTGFMLTRKPIASVSIGSMFSKSEKNLDSYLTLPAINFLRNLIEISPNNEKDKDNNDDSLVPFMENTILNGTVLLIDLPTPDFLYLQRGMNEPLPLYISSGVVTETSPLFLFVKYFESKGHCFLIEEPEISLHPELQRAMARVLVKMLNSGRPLVIATHSDIIIQHINNMIKLNNRSDKDMLLSRLNYQTDDLLALSKVNVYQFKVNEKDETEISKIEWNNEDGFKAQTFIDPLAQMLDETMDIEEAE